MVVALRWTLILGPSLLGHFHILDRILPGRTNRARTLGVEVPRTSELAGPLASTLPSCPHQQDQVRAEDGGSSTVSWGWGWSWDGGLADTNPTLCTWPGALLHTPRLPSCSQLPVSHLGDRREQLEELGGAQGQG